VQPCLSHPCVLRLFLVSGLSQHGYATRCKPSFLPTLSLASRLIRGRNAILFAARHGAATSSAHRRDDRTRARVRPATGTAAAVRRHLNASLSHLLRLRCRIHDATVARPTRPPAELRQAQAGDATPGAAAGRSEPGYRYRIAQRSAATSGHRSASGAAALPAEGTETGRAARLSALRRRLYDPPGAPAARTQPKLFLESTAGASECAGPPPADGFTCHGCRRRFAWRRTLVQPRAASAGPAASGAVGNGSAIFCASVATATSRAFEVPFIGGRRQAGGTADNATLG